MSNLNLFYEMFIMVEVDWYDQMKNLATVILYMFDLWRHLWCHFAIFSCWHFIAFMSNLTKFSSYRKIPEICPPEYKPPTYVSPPNHQDKLSSKYKLSTNKVKGDFQVQLLNLPKAGKYANSNRLKIVRTILDRF